jgi:hypothetical protein
VENCRDHHEAAEKDDLNRETDKNNIVAKILAFFVASTSDESATW